MEDLYSVDTEGLQKEFGMINTYKVTLEILEMEYKSFDADFEGDQLQACCYSHISSKTSGGKHSSVESALEHAEKRKKEVWDAMVELRLKINVLEYLIRVLDESDRDLLQKKYIDGLTWAELEKHASVTYPRQAYCGTNLTYRWKLKVFDRMMKVLKTLAITKKS